MDRDSTKSTKSQEVSREAWLERLRNAGKVVVHQGSGQPFVPEVWVVEGTDELWLIGRRDEEATDEADRDRRGLMAQRKPDERPLEMDEEALERIRNDPRVIVHRQKTTEPYVSRLRVTPGLDVLELLGRRGDDDEDEDAVVSERG